MGESPEGQVRRSGDQRPGTRGTRQTRQTANRVSKLKVLRLEQGKSLQPLCQTILETSGTVVIEVEAIPEEVLVGGAVSGAEDRLHINGTEPPLFAGGHQTVRSLVE